MKLGSGSVIDGHGDLGARCLVPDAETLLLIIVLYLNRNQTLIDAVLTALTSTCIKLRMFAANEKVFKLFF